ncbi:hypothetical protein WR25_26965 [Diploscapter pachys]|uniref:RNA helicase n=1 Tax=Diploscapter pachys TaxID=2018661 RepID=A0A2A2JM26_9BILA|nr:hypothetical protein WR25_26965 [Diploscapter pachys]
MSFFKSRKCAQNLRCLMNSQKHSIPTLLENRDLMSCAQTGSGKTAAFLLPIISHILTDGPGVVKGPTQVNGRRVYNPAVLVLSPTRELAIQIHKESAKFSYRTNLITAILYGGRENYREQLNRLRNGCHILIATPGRLIDVLEQGLIGLGGVRYLVLDEADRMLDMGFEPQIRKIVNNGMPPKTNRVTAMFSATFPKEIQILAQDFLKQNYVFLAVGRVGSTSDNIEQNLIWVEETQKRHTLGNILENEEMGSLVLIFVETKRSANDLSYFLSRSGLSSVPIHGDLKQYERERNLDMFKSGQCPVLVATAVAARGLDIPNVRHVINYDLPGDIDEYVHRIGRTGRCGNVGKATSFFNDKNRVLARDLLEIVKETHQVAPDWLVRIASESRSYGGGNRGGYRGGNSSRFGGTDHRRGSGRGGFNGGTSTFNSAPSINTWNQPPSQAAGGWQKSFGGGQAQGSAGGNGYGNSGFGKTRGGRGGGFNNSGNGSSSNYYGSGSRGGGTSYGGNQGFGAQQSAPTRGNHGYAGYSS